MLHITGSITGRNPAGDSAADREAPIPAVGVSWEAGSTILRLLERSGGKGKVHLKLENRTFESTSQNVIGEIVGSDDYQYGGGAGTLATNFGEAICPLFTDPPGAYLHRQASFIQSFIADCPGGEALVPGEDYDFFLFPPIDEEYGSPGLGGADLFVMFNDNENTRALMEFLTQPEALAGWLEGGGSGIATNNQFPLDRYPDPLSRRAAEVLQQVDAFRFDASDLMPGDVNQAFWTGTLDFVQNPDALPDILERIEAIADEAYAAD